jgi:hypothetical protein
VKVNGHQSERDSESQRITNHGRGSAMSDYIYDGITGRFFGASGVDGEKARMRGLGPNGIATPYAARRRLFIFWSVSQS